MRIRTLSSLLSLAIAACAHAPEPTHASSSRSASSADAPHAGSILFWHASKKGKPGSVYLLGSVHLRSKKASLDRAITDAATECERGAFELDLDAVDPKETNDFVRTEGMLEGKTLKDVVKPETYAAWGKAADANHIPRNMFERFKPWMVALSLGVAANEKRGFVADQGIDKMLYAFEKQEPSKSRKVVGLETQLDQLRLFSGASAKTQDFMLWSTATEITKDQAGQLINLYEKGDEAGMIDVLQVHAAEPEAKPFVEALFDRRNVTMTEKIVPMFDTAGCTVVTVGAGHVLGESGILRRLRDQGFEIERIASRGPTDSARMAFTVTKPKEFVSREDGFSVHTPSMPATQEIPIPGGGGTARSYVFSEGVTALTTLEVLAIPDAAVPKVNAMLESLTKQGLAKEGMTVTGAEPATVYGEKAVRVHSESRQGDVIGAETVSWVHSHHFYSATARLLGDVDRKRLDEQLDGFLKRFEHTP